MKKKVKERFFQQQLIINILRKQTNELRNENCALRREIEELARLAGVDYVKVRLAAQWIPDTSGLCDRHGGSHGTIQTCEHCRAKGE